VSISGRLKRLYTGAVYDVLRAMGRLNVALPPQLRPINPKQTIAGPIFTVSGEPTTELDAHETLLLWTEFLSVAEPRSIVVCQPNDSTLSHMGELSAETLQIRDVRGYIVDGGCRDVSFLLEQGFPVWCRYFTPTDIVGRWAVRRTGEPVTIGEVTIHPGDYAIADLDGVVIVPRDLVIEVVSAAEEVVSTENAVRTAILDGTDPKDAYLQYGKF
jgi:4-hydroxy-4-methyl-2-oxoglutarate aldolase